MADGRLLQIYRDGRRYPKQTVQLPTGAQANLITLFEMAKVVREDSQFADLRNFAFREVIGLDKTTVPAQMNAAFDYCRDMIMYRDEGEDTETIADLWSCLYALNDQFAVGDCAIKSVALATLLSFMNLKPYFIALRQIPNADFFNHVFVGVQQNDKELGMDPTPESFKLGEEQGYVSRISYRIFE